ncbi:MAG TPA: methylamine utilization protein [Thermoanaerobaculia bacterium]|nr:methylamine utilization protein [Thermoanaerobaculia bacterium]
MVLGRFLAAVTLLLSLAITASAASILVEVRDPQGAPLPNAVVYAVIEGREIAPSNRTAVMDQKDKTFLPHVLPVQVGTAVKFPNSDDIQHHVYSFSAAKTFQLPLYKGTPANPVVFTSPGVVTLGCNIHDKMNGYIVVLETPFFEKSEASGRVEIRNLQPGKYTVHVWHPDMAHEPPVQSVALGESEHPELTFSVTAAPAALTTAPLNKLEGKFKKYGNGNGRP